MSASGTGLYGARAAAAGLREHAVAIAYATAVVVPVATYWGGAFPNVALIVAGTQQRFGGSPPTLVLVLGPLAAVATVHFARGLYWSRWMPIEAGERPVPRHASAVNGEGQLGEETVGSGHGGGENGPRALRVRRIEAALLVVVVGIVAALLAGLADPLAIGSGGFGWKQIVLLIVGLVAIAVGARAALRIRRSDLGDRS